MKELYDKEFVENWTYGFEELKERVKDYTPEKVSADYLGAGRENYPGCPLICHRYPRLHPGRQFTGKTGQLRSYPEGDYLSDGSLRQYRKTGQHGKLGPAGYRSDRRFLSANSHSEEDKKKIIGGDKFKLGAARTCNPDTLVKKIIAGEAPIKVWFSVGGQQIVHMANTKEVVEAIKKVEFMVHCDLFMGPMAEASDIVLPVAHWLELDDIYDMHPRFMIEAHNKVVEPPGEAKSDVWIFNEIGKRVAPKYWFKDVEACLDDELKKGNITWKEFSKRLVSGCWGKDQVYYKYKTDYWRKGGGFPTPTGKFEFYSKVLEALGYDPLPQFEEPGESPYSTPELYKEYPLVMTSGYRQPFYFLSQYRNIPWLRSFMEYPTAQIHPETAKKYGIEDGDWIWIESPRGRIRQKARLFPGILKGVLMATANCFYPEEPAKGFHGLFISNPNVLTSNDHLDPMYGSPDLTCLLCKVYKCYQRRP